MKQGTWYSIFVLFAALLCSQAHSESGPYLGASLGNAKVGFKSVSDDLNLDDSEGNDVGWKLYGGFKFTILAAEAGYVNFGTIEENNVEGSVEGFTGFGVLSLGLGPAEIFGKVGGFIWETDVEVASQRYEEDGFDPAVGIGAMFNLGGLGVRGEYEYFDIEDLSSVSMLSVGVTYWF